MHKRQQFSTFQSYLKDRERRIRRLVAAIEKRGVEEALDRCRLLVDHINRDLRDKEFGEFVNISSLADLQVAIERAASLLDGIAAYGENQRQVDAPNNAKPLLRPCTHLRGDQSTAWIEARITGRKRTLAMIALCRFHDGNSRKNALPVT